MLAALSSVDAFVSMTRPTAFSNTAIMAEVGDMPAAEIPAVPEVAASSIPDVPASASVPALSTDSTSAQIIPNNEFAPPTPSVPALSTDSTSAQIILNNEFAPPNAPKIGIDPEGPQPPPMPPVNDLDTIALVAGQENYGFAVVLLGEAIWSFSQAPSVDHGLKTLLPAIVAAAVLGVVSGPMVTSGDASSVSTGLFIATGVSIAMGLCYAARLSASYSPSPKEIPALGLLVAFAGFFSFSQNLMYDGFVKLPSIPLPTLPSLPSIPLPF